MLLLLLPVLEAARAPAGFALDRRMNCERFVFEEEEEAAEPEAAEADSTAAAATAEARCASPAASIFGWCVLAAAEAALRLFDFFDAAPASASAAASFARAWELSTDVHAACSDSGKVACWNTSGT